MSGISGKKVTLGQGSGPDVELVVSGTPLYATYETPDGYPAIYDPGSGLFHYARVVDGRYVGTGVPVTSSPPGDVQRHAKESDEVREAKIRARQLQMESRSQQNPSKE